MAFTKEQTQTKAELIKANMRVLQDRLQKGLDRFEKNLIKNYPERSADMFLIKPWNKRLAGIKYVTKTLWHLNIDQLESLSEREILEIYKTALVGYDFWIKHHREKKKK